MKLFILVARGQIFLDKFFPFAKKCIYFQTDKIVQQHTWVHIKGPTLYTRSISNYWSVYQTNIFISENINKLLTYKPSTWSLVWVACNFSRMSLEQYGHNQIPQVSRWQAPVAHLTELSWRWPYWEKMLCAEKELWHLQCGEAFHRSQIPFR